MRKLLPFALLSLLLFGCRRASLPPLPREVIQPERIPSLELQLTARLLPDPQAAQTLEITLRNVGQRTLVFDTGFLEYPIADFAFSLDPPDHQLRDLICQKCKPGSCFGQLDPYTLRLKPLQLHRFPVPASVFFAVDPRNGQRLDLEHLHGHILIELLVPTPPHAAHTWPGYVSASLPLP